MKSNIVFQLNQLQAFDSKFSKYLKLLNKHIEDAYDGNKKNEVNKYYFNTIEHSFKEKKFNFEQYSQLKNVLNDYTFTSQKRDEIDEIENIFIDILDFESRTMSDRSIEKTLDISNEIYANLTKNIIRLNNNYKKNWSNIYFEGTTIPFTFPGKKNQEEISNDKRDYQYSIAKSSDRR